jgi:hypothetical protein
MKKRHPDNFRMTPFWLLRTQTTISGCGLILAIFKTPLLLVVVPNVSKQQYEAHSPHFISFSCSFHIVRRVGAKI